MKKEDLRETKIYLSSVEDRIKFQKKMFSLGIRWFDLDGVRYTDCPFYYISRGFYLELSKPIDSKYFRCSDHKQIFLHDVLAIKEPNKVCKFNPFDRVLVRDLNIGLWGAKFFSHYDDEDDSFPYITTDDSSYSQCIKYEGNEHLLMTSDSE